MVKFLEEWVKTGEAFTGFTVMFTLTDQKGSSRRSRVISTTATAIVPTRTGVVPVGVFLRETGVLDEDGTIRVSDGLKSQTTRLADIANLTSARSSAMLILLAIACTGGSSSATIFMGAMSTDENTTGVGGSPR